MAIFNLEESIKHGVEQALNEPIHEGLSVLDWAKIGMNGPRWISVKDRMPDDGLLNKLVFDSEGQIRICGKVATFTQGNGEKVFIPDAPIIDSLLLGAKSYEDVWKITHITHWMQLPEPPKGGK